MKVHIILNGLPIAEIQGSLRPDNIIDGRLVWQRFPTQVANLLEEYTGALEDISLHGWDDFRESIQRLGLEAKGDLVGGAVDDLQVFTSGASLVRIRGKDPK